MSYVNETLGAIPFEQIIGAPLKAAVEAQTIAAKATVDFIREVGFVKLTTDNNREARTKQDYGDVRNVVFKYAVIAEDGTQKTATLSVPILTIVPVPYIRIDDISIDFTANITEKEEKKQTQSTEQEIGGGANVKFWSPVRVGFKAKIAKSSSSSQTGRYSTEYRMNIHLNAVQDDIPAGLAKVLNILENSITSQNRTIEGSGRVTFNISGYEGYKIILPGYGTKDVGENVSFDNVAFGSYQVELTKEDAETVIQLIVVNDEDVTIPITRS